MQVVISAASDIGRVRRENQDSFFVDDKFRIGIVCDGIGGRQGGKMASQIAVDTTIDALAKNLPHELKASDPLIEVGVIQAVEKANSVIVDTGEKDENLNGMGTTIELLVFMDKHVFIAHVGDSRTYLFYANHLWQLTIDHNVETLVEQGMLDPVALTPSNRNSLVRALGIKKTTEVDVYQHELKNGEIFITASDGLFDMVEDEDICRLVFENHDNIQALPKILIDEANKNGGRDNITVMVSKVG